MLLDEMNKRLLMLGGWEPDNERNEGRLILLLPCEVQSLGRFDDPKLPQGKN